MIESCCFINSNDPPLKENVICHYTSMDVYSVHLFEVVAQVYPHPDCADMTVPIIITRLVRSSKKTELEAAPLILLDAAQKNITLALEK